MACAEDLGACQVACAEALGACHTECTRVKVEAVKSWSVGAFERLNYNRDEGVMVANLID